MRQGIDLGHFGEGLYAIETSKKVIFSPEAVNLLSQMALGHEPLQLSLFILTQSPSSFIFHYNFIRH